MLPESINFNTATQNIEETDKLERFNGYSYLYDFKKNDFIYKNGNPVRVGGKEAIKIWIEKALRTRIYTYGIYDEKDSQGLLSHREYGSNIWQLIRGRKLPHLVLRAEIIRDIEETLSYNDRIKRVENVEMQMGGEYEDSYKLRIQFTVILHDNDTMEMEVEF